MDLQSTRFDRLPTYPKDEFHSAQCPTGSSHLFHFFYSRYEKCQRITTYLLEIPGSYSWHRSSTEIPLRGFGTPVMRLPQTLWKASNLCLPQLGVLPSTPQRFSEQHDCITVGKRKSKPYWTPSYSWDCRPTFTIRVRFFINIIIYKRAGQIRSLFLYVAPAGIEPARAFQPKGFSEDVHLWTMLQPYQLNDFRFPVYSLYTFRISPLSSAFFSFIRPKHSPN